jgi:broad specificity phosphatase PhoE
MKLLLAKHALPEIEPERPSREWRLSAEGRAQCVWLADRFAEAGVSRVLSSAEPKAVETAQIAAQRIGLAPLIGEGLHENDRTGLAFLGADSLRRRMIAFFDAPDQLVIGAESARAAQARFSAAVEFAIAQSAGETLAIVAHGTVITLLVAHHNAIDPFAFWESLTLPAVVILDGDTLALERVIPHPGV